MGFAEYRICDVFLQIADFEKSVAEVDLSKKTGADFGFYNFFCVGCSPHDPRTPPHPIYFGTCDFLSKLYKVEYTDKANVIVLDNKLKKAKEKYKHFEIKYAPIITFKKTEYSE